MGTRGGGGRGDDSLTNKFNTAAADNRHTPPATTTTGKESGGEAAKGAASGLSGGPVIDKTWTGTVPLLEKDKALPDYTGAKVSDDANAGGGNVNRPKGP